MTNHLTEICIENPVLQPSHGSKFYEHKSLQNTWFYPSFMLLFLGKKEELQKDKYRTDVP